ncbi:MAG TPA: hypothetical protein VGU46_14320 [Acidobacteriaceae bacterium]|nr:hypothetical protein [Acidobacteriaceae bacterium]
MPHPSQLHRDGWDVKRSHLHPSPNPNQSNTLPLTPATDISYGISPHTSPTIQTTSRQNDIWGGRGVYLLIAALFTLTAVAPAQTPQKPTPTIPALFLSDIHLDPYADPAKVVKLNASPASEWPAILTSAPSPTQQQDSSALRAACPTRGLDTDTPLFQSALKAIHTQAAHARFATISGDLLAHSFDCKYKHLLPQASPADYVAFTQKTILYILTQLHLALPQTTIYTALGNNDSGCTDYHLDATNDPFLAAVAPTITQALQLPKSEQQAILSDLASIGSYNAPLAAIPHTRVIVLDDLFLSREYATCAAKPDPNPAATQLSWLATQLASARSHHEQVWVIGHIPPGVNLYASARKLLSLCSGDAPKEFLASNDLADLLARNSDVIRLALFGHTHFDELRLLTSPLSTSTTTPDTPPLDLQMSDPTPDHARNQGVPLKLVSSITPINTNRPTFTLAKIDPTTATLLDYTVIEASNSTGIGTIWAPSYTYSTAYHQPAFDAASLSNLIAMFAADPTAKTPPSQSYLQNFAPGSPVSALIQLIWPQYTCSLNHTTTAAFTNCACTTHPTPPQTDKPAPN